MLCKAAEEPCVPEMDQHSLSKLLMIIKSHYPCNPEVTRLSHSITVHGPEQVILVAQLKYYGEMFVASCPCTCAGVNLAERICEGTAVRIESNMNAS
jgi:hypothetical protein